MDYAQVPLIVKIVAVFITGGFYYILGFGCGALAKKIFG